MVDVGGRAEEEGGAVVLGRPEAEEWPDEEAQEALLEHDELWQLDAAERGTLCMLTASNQTTCNCLQEHTRTPNTLACHELLLRLWGQSLVLQRGCFCHSCRPTHACMCICICMCNTHICPSKSVCMHVHVHAYESVHVHVDASERVHARA